MPIPFWTGHYLGIPFKTHGRGSGALDCWGLVRLVLAEQFGIALPSYINEYESVSHLNKINDVFYRDFKRYIPINYNNEECGDIVVMLIRNKPAHFGIVLGDNHMLHIEQNCKSSIEKYDDKRWDDRIYGFYRYKSPLEN